MPVIVLPSFSKGEISPTLHARVDTAMYRSGLATARNCIIHPYGGISNRPGSVCIGPVKDHTVSTTRLFRFHLGDTDQYVLEFGASYMRVIRNDAFVTETATTVTAATKADPVVITANSHGLSNDDEVVLNDIGGMVEISGGRYIVQNVTSNTFELTHQTTGVNVDGTSYTTFSASNSDEVAQIFELTTPYAAADLSTIKMVQSGNVITITHPSYAPRDLTRTNHNVWSLTTLVYAPALAAPTNLTASASTNNNFQVFQNRNQTVRYEVTSISDTDEFFEESLAISVTLTDSSDPPLNTLSWTAESAAQRYAIYRQDNGLFGLIGETEDTTFEDDNFASDLTISPPRARNPFTGSGNFPATSGYYEQRQLYGGTNNNPDTWFASQTGLRLNMSVSTPLQADDAITASLSAQDVQIIRHFVPLDDLLILTNSGEWRVNSGGDSHFSSDTVKQKPQEFWGSDHMQPIIIGKTIFYVEDGGGRVRSLGFSLQSDGYQSSDMNLLANHLLVEDGPNEFIITDWAVQQFPEPRLYIVRSDGKLLTMTFNQEQQVIAWTTWDTDGNYESITSLRRSLSNVEDGLYFLVQRTIDGETTRLIERMHTRKFADVRDTFFLDSGTKLDTPKTITNVTVVDPGVWTSTAHGFSNGDEVEITGVEWEKTVDSFGNETNPDVFNDRRFTLANTTANTFELLKRAWGTGADYDIDSFLPDTTFNLVDDVDGDPRTIEFNDVGTKMYILDDDPTATLILEYDLADAFDIGTATHSNVTFDYGALTTVARGMSFSGSDGTTLLLAGYDNNIATIYELTLSTGFDLSTASDSTRSFDASATVDEIFDIDADSSGTRLYVGARSGGIIDTVFQYTLTGSNISTAVLNKTLDVRNPAGVLHLRSVFLKDNGTQMFILDDARGLNDDDTSAFTFVHEFTLATAFDIETATIQSRTTLNQITCAKGIFIEPDIDTGAFDLTTAVYNNNSVSVSGNTGGQDIEFRPNGLTMYKTSGTSDKNIITFTLSTAWDITTATDASQTLDVSGSITQPAGLSFRDTGDKAFILDGGGDIEQWTFSTDWDISTGTASGTVKDVSTEDSAPRDIFVRANGLRMWMVGNTNDTVYQYTLSTAWDLSSASYDSAADLDISGQDSSPQSLHIGSNGTKLFIVGDSNDTIYQYTMSTAYDLSTASFDSVSFDLNDKVESIFSIRGGFFKPDGKKFFILDNFTVKVYEIDVGSTSVPTDRKMTVTGGCTSPAVFQASLSTTTGDEGLENVTNYLSDGEARLTVSIITGLHCLNGETVTILADGNIEVDQTVVNNIITIDNSRKVARAAVGLPFVTDIETLNIEVPSPPSTIQDKVKKITDVMIRFYKSRMPFIGPNNTDMIELKGRELEDYGTATELLTGDRTVNIPPSWNTQGRLFIRMRAPVPLTILGIFPEMTVEDDL